MKQRVTIISFYTLRQFITSPYISLFFILVTYTFPAVPTFVPIHFAWYIPHLLHIFSFIPTLFMRLYHILSTYLGGISDSSLLSFFREFFVPTLLCLVPIDHTSTCSFCSQSSPGVPDIIKSSKLTFWFSVVLIVVPLSQ